VLTVLQGLQPDLRAQAEPLLCELFDTDDVDQVADLFAQMLRLLD